MKYLLYIILLIISFITGYFYGKTGWDPKNYKRLIIHDTTLVQKWERKIERDTIVKFIDRIFLKEIPAKVITYQTVDTVFIKKVEKLNTFLDVEKYGDSLKVFTINIDKSMAKEFSFPSSMSEFRLIAKNDDVFYAEKRYFILFNGFRIGPGIYFNKDIEKFRWFIELNTGVEFFKTVGFELYLNSSSQAGLWVYYKF